MSDYNGPCESNDCSEWSQPSDERMDTGSESLLSTQHTPNSLLSSDADDEPPAAADAHRRTLEASTEVLRLQNPSDNTEEITNHYESLQPSANVLRLNEPTNDNENYRNVDKFSRYRDNKCDSEDVETQSNFKSKEAYAESPLRYDDLNDSLTRRMPKLQIENDPIGDGISRPSKLGLGPPRMASQLTITSSHPLMGLTSPDGVDYPDIVPERPRRNLRIEEETKDLSLSSIEEDKYTNGSFTDLYHDGPQRNTSKNNLYFSDSFSIAESHEISLNAATPDVARVQNGSYPPSKLIDGATRRKIVPCFRETDHLSEKTLDRSPRRVLGRPVDYSTPNLVEKAIGAYVEERNRKLLEGDDRGEQTRLPKIDVSKPLDIPPQEFDTGPADWVESPSQLRSMTNFQLPVELSSSAVEAEECGSPEPLSTSTEERSLYRALVDPASGSVALKHTPTQRGTSGRRRIIAVVESVDTDGEPEPDADEDRLSLDSVSACSLPSEEADLPVERVGVVAGPGAGVVACAAAAARGDSGSASDDDSHRNTQSDYSEPIPEYSYAEEQEHSEERNFRKIPLPSGGHLLCDMKVIEPYMRVLSHGGYAPHGAHIIVFSACHLPDSARKDYSYVVDNLFLYVLWTLDRLVTDEYELVYLHGSASKHRMPNFQWLKKSYQLIDRRLRKSLKHLYLVHPTFWLKSIVFMSKPFISSKFSRKLSYVHTLAELFERVRVEPAAIPQQVKDYDLGRQS